MAILDLALHPFAYVTIAELSDYWRLSRERVLAHLIAGHFEAIELGPGVYRVRARTALEFERQIAVAKRDPAVSLVAWPADRVRASGSGADGTAPLSDATQTPAARGHDWAPAHNGDAGPTQGLSGQQS